MSCLPLLLVLLQEDWAEYRPFVEPASDEPLAVQVGIALADGLDVSLWAAEPLVANPVCLALDGKGAIYVAESFRCHAGVTDIREHMDWLDDDLACETVADRVAMFETWLGPDFGSYAREHDRVRRLSDTDGDGVADASVVYADGFNHAADGIGSGLLVQGDDVFYTCIPDLWRLTDADGDGRAEEKESLSTGWGVRVAFLGHDMHGLRLGPDGRLYWSIGDRGFSVRTKEGELLHYPDTGAVLRCEPDGSGLEVVHLGLRNPQELAFDARGDLFTGDNNSDSGDLARLVPIVEGGDSGWRQPFQWIGDRGPWGREKLWVPRFDGQAAWLVPPIANLTSGPSGFTYEPGTALPAFADHFLLCDFTGEAGSSHVWAFPLGPDGAFFQLGEVRDLVSGILCTDADFGPDGALYVSDWVAGWRGTGKGRIWRITDGAGDAGTASLLGEGFAGSGVDELERLLAHADQRVRQAAHLELAARGELDALERAAQSGEGLARLHGTWGLGIALRRDPTVMTRLVGLFSDADPEVRAQAFHVLELEDAPRWIADAVRVALGDSEPRVAFHAALAAGRLRLPACADALVELAQRADPHDPLLRHAIARGLAGCANPAALASHASPAVRLHAVLALRQRRDPRLADFLGDADASVALEAACAIHDLPVPAAMESLAARLTGLPPAEEDAGLPVAKEGGPTPHDDLDALVRRVLNASDRLGQPQDARALASFALRGDQRAGHRELALEMLAEWKETPERDRLLGFAQPVAERDAASLPELARELVGAGLLDDEEAAIAIGTARLAAASGVADLAPPLVAVLDDEERALDLRVEALRALGELLPPDLDVVVDRTLLAREARLRAEALVALEALSPEQAVPRVLPLLDTGELEERRAAYQILGRAAPGVAEERLVEELDRLAADLVPVELHLDLILAAEARGGALAERVGARRAERMEAMFAAEGSAASVGVRQAGYEPDERDRGLPAVGMAVEPYVDGLFGGDREKGRGTYERASLSCGRCHARDEWGAQVVGPNLAGVGRRLGRLQLVESIVLPNHRTAPGYGSELLFLTDGEALSCRVLDEREDGSLQIADAQGRQRFIAPGDIDVRKPAISSMPDGLAEAITREEMRDLLEYLAGL